MSLAGHIRNLWLERDECINPSLPADLPEFCMELASSGDWRRAALARASTIDAEVDEMLSVMRELGITAGQKPEGAE